MPTVYSDRPWIYYREKQTYAKPQFWPCAFVYLYLLSNVVLFLGSCVVLFGFLNLSARYFLNPFGFFLPFTAVAGFVVSLLGGMPKEEKLYYSIAIQVWTWAGVSLLMSLWVGALTTIHIFLNGSKSSMQPLEAFSDVGTTYFFAVSSALVASCITFYLTLGVIYAYCENLFFPSEITFTPATSLKDGEVIKVKES